VGFVEQLDTLDRDPRRPAQKLREALAMYDEGLALQRRTLRRQHPRLSAEDLDRKLSSWLLREESA
jgi:hypothetical protein